MNTRLQTALKKVNTIAANTADNNATMIFEITDKQQISIQGPDAINFLQGQLSCDIKALNAEQTASLAAHHNPKGRMLSSGEIFWLADEHFIYVVDASIAEDTLKNLNKYAVFSKVELSLSGCNGIGIAIAQKNDQASNTINQLVKNQNKQHIHLPELFDPESNADVKYALHHIYANEDALSKLLTALNPEEFIALDNSRSANHFFQNQLGLLLIDKTHYEAYTPHVLNYQHTSAIGFKKGCYTGQEIIARTHYKGKTKKHIYALMLEAQSPLNFDESSQWQLSITALEESKDIELINPAALKIHNAYNISALCIINEDQAAQIKQAEGIRLNASNNANNEVNSAEVTAKLVHIH